MTNKEKLDKLNSMGYKASQQVDSSYKKGLPSGAIKAIEELQEDLEFETLRKNAYYVGKMRVMEDQIKALQLDVVTLLDIMHGEFPDLSMSDARGKYTTFRSLEEHVEQRINDKSKLIKQGNI